MISENVGLLFLQRLSWICMHEAEGLEGNRGEGHEQDKSEGDKIQGRGVPDADRIGLEPTADIGI